MATTLSNLGDVVRCLGDYERAAALLEESLALQRELGDTYSMAYSLRTLAGVMQVQGDRGRAMTLYKESLMVLKEVNDKRPIAECLEGLAEIAGAQGQPERAARLLAAAATLRETIGTPLPPSERADYDRTMAAARTALGDEALAIIITGGEAMRLEQAVAYALGETGHD
jgi:tetratricopeptide (TPR) repeat protein